MRIPTNIVLMDKDKHETGTQEEDSQKLKLINEDSYKPDAHR